MGSKVEFNYVLQITSEQGFPKELNLKTHKKDPFTAEDFHGQIFEFYEKPDVRLFQLPPVHVFLAQNIDGKWLYWGQIVVTELTHDNVKKTTSGKFRIIKIFTPEEMKMAEKIISNPDWKKNYFNEKPIKESLRFKYKNWEGKVGIRTVRPIKVWFGTTEWHPGDHWFLKAHDLDKDAERDFPLADIIEIYPVDNNEVSDKVI